MEHPAWTPLRTGASLPITRVLSTKRLKKPPVLNHPDAPCLTGRTNAAQPEMLGAELDSNSRHNLFMRLGAEKK